MEENEEFTQTEVVEAIANQEEDLPVEVSLRQFMEEVLTLLEEDLSTQLEETSQTMVDVERALELLHLLLVVRIRQK